MSRPSSGVYNCDPVRIIYDYGENTGVARIADFRKTTLCNRDQERGAFNLVPPMAMRRLVTGRLYLGPADVSHDVAYTLFVGVGVSVAHMRKLAKKERAWARKGTQCETTAARGHERPTPDSTNLE